MVGKIPIVSDYLYREEVSPVPSSVKIWPRSSGLAVSDLRSNRSFPASGLKLYSRKLPLFHPRCNALKGSAIDVDSGR